MSSISRNDFGGFRSSDFPIAGSDWDCLSDHPDFVALLPEVARDG